MFGQGHGRRRRLLAGTALLAILAMAGVVSLTPVRDGLLRTVGAMLMAEDPLAPAERVVLPTAVFRAGELEAADLVGSGHVPRVLVMQLAETDLDREFFQRGVTDEDPAAQSLRRLRSLGITAGQLESVIGGDMGYAMGRYVVSSSPGDERTPERSGHYIEVCRLVDGEWKMVSDIMNVTGESEDPKR